MRPAVAQSSARPIGPAVPHSVPVAGLGAEQRVCYGSHKSVYPGCYGSVPARRPARPQAQRSSYRSPESLACPQAEEVLPFPQGRRVRHGQQQERKEEGQRLARLPRRLCGCHLQQTHHQFAVQPAWREGEGGLRRQVQSCGDARKSWYLWQSFRQERRAYTHTSLPVGQRQSRVYLLLYCGSQPRQPKWHRQACAVFASRSV
mmetsp:Transcript_28620/g.56230  ORF Transcript_28620/g.56230 Transcript_28620/m.56230 type:complete len:203 (-) Transcript_28620:709-1317(-)